MRHEAGKDKVWEILFKIREENPVLHCISNIVTANDCANILLAAGASPTMAYEPCEVAEINSLCGGLVCNMGAIPYFESMRIAAKTADSLSRPIIIDPVGLAFSQYRRDKFYELIRGKKIAAIRGNLSEIRAIEEDGNTSGRIDVSKEDEDASHDMKMPTELVLKLARRLDSIVIASGARDFLSDGKRVFAVDNGSSLMKKVSGMGCMSSAFLGAALAVENSLESAVSAVALIGLCGEEAERLIQKEKKGIGSFKRYFMDAIYLFDYELAQKARIQIVLE